MTQELPLACDMDAMNAGQRARHHALAARLKREVQGILELPDGLTVYLPAAAWLAAAEFVSLESLCCPFLRFRLEMAAAGGQVLLSLTGPAGVREFLRAELGI